MENSFCFFIQLQQGFRLPVPLVGDG